MKTPHTHKKICDSWYHQRWFRVLLVVVGIDMIFLGGAFAFGFDITNLIDMTHPLLRMLGGAAYIIVAIFIIHYALSYSQMKKTQYLVCQYCAEGDVDHKENV